MTITAYDPENWLETLVRGVNDYASDGFNNAVKDADGNPAGLEIFDVVMGFPGPDLDAKKMPLTKTLIHFEIDDIQDRPLGIGENVFATNYDADTQTVQNQSAVIELVNFDVGIWSSDRTGGTTARMRARTILGWLFGQPLSIESLRSATDGGDGGVEIMNYRGGNFVPDRINDVPVYRMVDGQLNVRVYSRTPLSDVTPAPTIEEIVQQSGLTILG